MIHTRESNNNPSSKELANCPGFNFNTRVWIYNHFSWLFLPPMKYVAKEVALFRLNYFVTKCSAVGGNILYAKANAFWIIFKLTAAVSRQRPGGAVNWSWTGTEPSIIYLSNSGIYSSRQAINVFSVCAAVSPTLRCNKTWLFMEEKKSHKNLLSLVTRTKLFASGRGWELEITCWRVSRIKKMTFMLQQHLLQILGSIIVCTVHIIVNKLLWWMEDALKAERIVWIHTIMYRFVTQTQRWQNKQSSYYRAKQVFFGGGGGWTEEEKWRRRQKYTVQ